ncbi:hypothetical protein BO71DRAFT_397889 [Aspergillus ellipticus CBS 707.79]|uniref:Uncharacterized protein n=1 Tax=Aspergillus ellipticus CBS 707.79 TaxID=1448320 RepID=A0A319DDT4_9EURO|nr:hypothetical protein BO71DRAFT_397889 [Aspergillus ellipticus CBS 707.79]
MQEGNTAKIPSNSLRSVPVLASDNEDTAMNSVMSLLGEIDKDVNRLSRKIDRVSVKMQTHFHLLASRILADKDQPRVQLSGWKEYRFASVWILLQKHIQERFQDQLSRVSEAGAGMKRAHGKLLKPEQYRDLCNILQEEFENTARDINNLRELAACDEAPSPTSLNTPRPGVYSHTMTRDHIQTDTFPYSPSATPSGLAERMESEDGTQEGHTFSVEDWQRFADQQESP